MSEAQLYRLPQRILVARRAKSISQAALANAVGVGASRISLIETGSSGGVADELVNRISAALNLEEHERRAMLLAAAHDRVMREVVKNPSFVDSQEFLATCLDAAPAISADLRDCWSLITRRLASRSAAA